MGVPDWDGPSAEKWPLAVRAPGRMWHLCRCDSGSVVLMRVVKNGNAVYAEKCVTRAPGEVRRT